MLEEPLELIELVGLYGAGPDFEHVTHVSECTAQVQYVQRRFWPRWP